MSENKLIPPVITAVISVLLLAGVLTVFSACGIKDDGTWMRCHDAQNTVAVCAAALTVIFAVCALLKNKILRMVLDIAGIVIAAAAFLIPGTISPMCMLNTMRCYTVMQPFVRIMTVIIILLGIWDIIKTVKKQRS